MPDLNPQAQPTLSASSSASADFEVHTMPEKFLSIRPAFKMGRSSKSGKKPMTLKKNLIVGLIIVVVIGALMSLAAWLFLKSVDEDKASPVRMVKPPAAEPVVNQQPTPPPPPETLPSQEAILDFDTWLGYDNEIYFYSLNHPKEWTPRVDNNPRSSQGALHLVAFDDESDTQRLALAVFGNLQGDALLSWLSAKYSLDQSDLDSFSLHNYSAYKYQDPIANVNNIYISFDDYFYTLTFPKTTDNVLNQAYAEILINFKLIAPEKEPIEQPPVILPATDTDRDQLTDVEEDLYNTNKNIPDSDADGYFDGNELINLYDPTSAGSGRIYDSNLVTTYVNPTYNYNIIYPSPWIAQGADNSVLFQDEAGEFIQVLITQNTGGHATINDWYATLIDPNLSSLTVTQVSDQSALREADGMRLYFLFGDHIYTLIYNIGLRTDANFMSTFDMMITSFSFMGSGN